MYVARLGGMGSYNMGYLGFNTLLYAKKIPWEWKWQL